MGGGSQVEVSDTTSGQIKLTQLGGTVGGRDEPSEPLRAVICQRALWPRSVQVGVRR